MAQKMTPRKRVFRRAIQILKRGGWFQGFKSSPGHHCAVTAIQAAAWELDEPAYRHYQNRPLVAFNDVKGRTATQVYRKLRDLAG